MDPTCDDVDSDDSGGSGAVDVVMIATDRYWYCRPSVVLLSLGCLPCPGPRNVRLVGVAVSVQYYCRGFAGGHPLIGHW